MYYQKKSKGIPSAEVWFCEPEGLKKKCAYLVCKNIYRKPEEKGCCCMELREQETLLSDLTQDDFFPGFASNVRNEIRRAAKDGAKCKLFRSEELRADGRLLAEFEKEYAEMHRLKDMGHSSSVPYLTRLAQSDMLAISVAYVNDEPVVYHVYVCGDEYVRLLYSVSSFRSADDGQLRNAIGRANRLLHYEDMLAFRAAGYHCYDWGGYGQTPEVKRISDFKAGFGGTQCTVYFYRATAHWPVYAAWKLRRRLRK